MYKFPDRHLPIKEYEEKEAEISDFVNQSMAGQGDVAVLRFLLSQHQLTLSDLPEIGHKSLVSKILSGERNLTRSHIEKLSKRFHIAAIPHPDTINL